MKAPNLYIIATGSYCAKIGEDGAPELKSLVKDATGMAVRRVTRFVQLALIGAGRCVQQRELSEDTAVYFSSCRGDIDVTVDLLEDMIRRREMPGPLTFVNSVSNAACFHVASVLGLKGRSNFITNRFDPLAAALKSAWVDLARGEVDTALVGSVDASSKPLEHHRLRIDVDDEQPFGEASHWLLVTSRAEQGMPLALISTLKNFCDEAELKTWLASHSFCAGTVLAPGQHLSADLAAAFIEMAGLSGEFAYRDALPRYDSQLGAAIEQFIAADLPAMLHVNSDPSGRFSVALVEQGHG